MQKLKIDFENCFGIGSLKHEFNFASSRSFLIYAPNGTMKTSFARTFDLIAKNDPKNMPCDRIYDARVTKCEILVDDNAINPSDILVINAEDNNFDASSKISTFLASKELKQRYDEIYQDLNEKKADFIRQLKTISQSTDCEGELISSFNEDQNKSFFETLLEIVGQLKDTFKKPQFKYNDVFDKKGNVKKFLEKNQTILDQYVNDYKNIISKSRFFKESVNSTFGTYQANEIIKSIEDNSFFDAGHKFVLEDGTEVTSSDILKEIIEQEVQSILNDEKLKQSFEKVDKAIAANVELRSFKTVIDKDNTLLVSLKNYDEFKKEVWVDFVSEIKKNAEELADHYEAQKIELQKIIDEARAEFALWTKIIKTFNARFFVPFKVIIANQDDMVLKQETANLEFEYSDRNDEPVRQKKENLLNILSKGEQRAYFILQFLFEIESRKIAGNANLLIFDDVADSFDYKNKFAIIEYLRELHHSNLFSIIILTHNFDFYRTIFSRLGIRRNAVYMASKTNEKAITLHAGQYKNDLFKHFIDRYAEEKVFISLLAFVRNLIEYSESEDCDDYLTLTSCLHRKDSSSTLTADQIFDIYKNRLVKLNGKAIPFGNENLIGLIETTAEAICNDANVDEILLENKITLAIAIRLKAEEYLISKLPNVDLTTITSNQTQALYQNYRSTYPASPAIDTLDKVNLMTPENIHINAFMYEPLIDMSVNHLVNLLQETNSLN